MINNDNYNRKRPERSVELKNYSTSGGRIAWWRNPNQKGNLLRNQQHIFGSIHERMSRSMPRETKRDSSSKIIYLKNQRTPTLRSFQKIRYDSSNPVKSIRSNSNMSNPKTEMSEQEKMGMFNGVQFRTMPNIKSDNHIHMSWVEKKKLNPKWKWGKKFTSNNKQSNSNLVVFKDERVFCIEDMENRLVHLFMKMLVYSSKIESLKNKLLRNNPNFSSGPLFNEFTSNQSKVLLLEDFGSMLNSFGFNMSYIMCQKLMIFLSKYRHTHKHHKIRSMHSLPPSSSNLQNILSPLDQNEMPNFGTNTSNMVEGEHNHPSTGPLTANRLVSSQLNISSQEKKFQYSLNFEDFREFLEKLNISEIRRSPYLSREGVAMKSMDYHLIRQIIILLLRKLEDMGNIIQSLQCYGSLGIFAYLLKFNPLYIKDRQIHSRVNSNITSPIGSLPNSEFKKFINNYKPPTPQKSERSAKRPNSITRFMKKRISKESKAKLLGKFDDSDDPDDDVIIGLDDVSTPQSRNFTSIKSSSMPLDYLGANLNNLSEDQLREKARLLIKGKKVINEDTIRNFLEFHQVQHMPRDLTFILSDLGTRSLELDLEMFDKFLFSDLWTI
jgi:hypothetical protein